MPLLIVGLALLLIGLFFAIHILYVIGIIALIVGGLIWLLSLTGHGTGNGRFW